MADQLFNRRKGIKKKRESASREIQPFRYLIVCEGEKTEPLYFDGVRKRINEKYGDKITVKDIKAERIVIDGTGRNTEGVVNYALEQKRKALIPYGHVWCVFDKDSYTDHQFNSAIQMCESYGLNVAWSNESIELWFILHFEFLNTGIDRKQYIDKLNLLFAHHKKNGGKYEKNIPDIFEILIEIGDIKRAIENSKKLDELYCNSDTPSKRKPATKVYDLIEDLLEYLGEPIN